MKVSHSYYDAIILLMASLSFSDAFLDFEYYEDGDEDTIKPFLGFGDTTKPKYLGRIYGDQECETYEMAHADKDFVADNDKIKEGMNWGLHALQWKAYQHAFEIGGTYDVALANAFTNPAAPSFGGNGEVNHVSSQGAIELDLLEKASTGIFKTSMNQPVDPNGNWVSVEETDPLAAAVTAAMNHYYWKTPTYVDLRTRNQYPGGVAVVEKVTLCVDGLQKPHDACGWSGPVVSCGNHELVLQSIKLARFDGGGFYKDWDNTYPFVMNAVQWASDYGKGNNITPVLVFDPPPGNDGSEVVASAERIVEESLVDPIEVAKAEKMGGIRG